MKYFDMPTSQSHSDAVILANGEFPKHAIPLSLLNNNSYLICCDGAIDKLMHNTNIRPQAIVGDCDSISTKNKELFVDILHPNPDQEINDLTKSVEYSLQQGFRRLIILGATGQREDHTLGNISLLLEYMAKADVEIITDYGVFVAIDEDVQFASYNGQQVSIFSITKDEITTHNLKYPVQNRIFTNWWQGTLNESMDNQFTIETTGKAIIYRAF